MTAAAFRETLIFKGLANGRIIHVPCSVSDVAAEYAIAPDGNGFVQLPSDQNYALVDAIVITGGTDTKVQDVFANGLNTGIKLDNYANLNTSYNRQFQGAPVAFKAGSLVRFKQAAA